MAATAVGVTIVAVVGFALLRAGAPAGEGPLESQVDIVEGQPVDVSAPYAFGSVLLTNAGDKPAIVEGVRLLGVDGPYRLLAVHTRSVPDERGRGLCSCEPVFPPVEWPTKPLREQNVVPVAKSLTPAGTPEQGLQIVLGVEVTEPGLARSREVEVTYRVGTRRYTKVYPHAIFLYAPQDPYRGEGRRCPPPEEEGRYGTRILP